MAKVDIIKKIKIGNITKIETETYETPNTILCPKDGGIMYYNSYSKSYVCTKSSCRNVITAQEYVNQELRRVEHKQEVDEEISNLKARAMFQED